jgi:hypothetical protein
MIKKTARLIVPGTVRDNPREAASLHPYDPDAVESTHYPRPLIRGRNIVATSKGTFRKTAVTMTGGSAATGASGTGSTSIAQSPLFYDYRWSSPDKFYFPRNRVVANSIWREIYKRDPTVAIGTDMYCELPWSEFDLVGIEDVVVRHIYEDMFSRLNLTPKLPAYTRDYLITGEFIPHAIFNSIKGIWQRIIAHNPDYITVENVGLVMDQPLLKLRPTPEIKKLLNTTDPRLKKLQKLLPKEIIHSFRANKEVPLDPINTSYIARMNLSNDIRGTSLYTRLYRIVMYEDFIVNASLAVAQRNAAPLRIFKLGDPNTGWIPDENEEAAFADMLSLAEADPLAAIIMHHNVTAELVGVSDRMILISREWDFIERVKLLAMGVARAFLVGETSFAASVAGLQSLIQRLASMRDKFTNEWISHKLCTPIAKIHEFYRRPEAELTHRIRVKNVEDLPLEVPKIRWKKVLEPNQDVAILNIWRDLKDRGLVSDRTYSAGSGVDLDVERKNLLEEKKYKDAHPELYALMQQAPGGPPSAIRPGMKPPLPAAGAPAPRAGSLDNDFLQQDLEDHLTSYADDKNKINVRDAAELVVDHMLTKSSQEQKLDLISKLLPPAGDDVLI